ncbi:MAG: ABC transporter ATP-binding protein [Corynebacterium sp.]|uniref:ABC transporter ATP-binding protein n=1 Tax=Corynebacterium sp. TaxID=1720 RepID=UPI0026DD480D|nr:ABC transporter ATP-binding protein [Corynebacterium sp.]MDO5098311.1 ABC transporter ATP-binding protein [Corynebacterium sp.]
MNPSHPVTIDHVTLRYPASNDEILTDFSFQPAPGSVTLICGASGSGKSSVLRLINGLIPHFHSAEYSGAVTVAGNDISTTELHTCGKLCATVFQNPKTQFFTTEVDSELAFANQNFQVPAAEIARRSAEALAGIGITELAGRSLNQLSGGQLQKVACAQALAQNTPLVLFDEPTSNLDAKAIDDFTTVVAQLKADGKTVIIAEHRLYFLRGLVDEVIVLDHGRIAHRFSGAEFFELSQQKVHEMGLRSLTRPVLTEAMPTTPATMQPGHVEKHTEADVIVENLKVIFGNRRVLDIGHMWFPAGQVTAIIGPNGAGKTTLARTLVGLKKPQRGSVIHGAASSFLVMQDVHRQLFTESVEAEAPHGFLARLDLDHLADRHPLSLSGGQKQRLVCATALSLGAHVVIFDEPTSGVDYRHLRAIAQLLKELAGEGKVVIVISHDIEFLNHCADQIVELVPVSPQP